MPSDDLRRIEWGPLWKRRHVVHRVCRSWGYSTLEPLDKSTLSLAYEMPGWNRSNASLQQYKNVNDIPRESLEGQEIYVGFIRI